VLALSLPILIGGAGRWSLDAPIARSLDPLHG
jgi:hypothetical protein